MPNMAITHHLSQVDVGSNESTITIPHRPDDGEINLLSDKASTSPPVSRRGGIKQRPRACYTWQPFPACRMARWDTGHRMIPRR